METKSTMGYYYIHKHNWQNLKKIMTMENTGEDRKAESLIA